MYIKNYTQPVYIPRFVYKSTCLQTRYPNSWMFNAAGSELYIIPVENTILDLLSIIKKAQKHNFIPWIILYGWDALRRAREDDAIYVM